MPGRCARTSNDSAQHVNAERTALKEWAVLVDAMVCGDFCAMIRKGGIREQRAGFAVRHDRFLMYPTFFHENSDELAPHVRARLADTHGVRPPEGTLVLSHVAEVRAQWRVTEIDVLREIEGEHGLTWKAVESRFHYKNNPGVHVIAVELMSLAHPVAIAESKRYLGCVSWVELDEAVDLGGSHPLAHSAETAKRIEKLSQVLGNPAAAEVL